MRYALAMGALATGVMLSVRRPSWPADQVVTNAEGPGGKIRMCGGQLYLPTAEDTAIADWTGVEAPKEISTDEAAQVEQSGGDSQPDDSAAAATDAPSTPAAESNTQPEDAGNSAAAPVADERVTQEPVSFDANGSPPAPEVAATVEEVVENSAAPAEAIGVQGG